MNYIIPFNTERFGIYHYYNNLYEQINYIDKEYILNNLHIKLYDLDGDYLDLNNQDYFLLLEYY